MRSGETGIESIRKQKTEAQVRLSVPGLAVSFQYRRGLAKIEGLLFFFGLGITVLLLPAQCHELIFGDAGFCKEIYLRQRKTDQDAIAVQQLKWEEAKRLRWMPDADCLGLFANWCNVWLTGSGLTGAALNAGRVPLPSLVAGADEQR